MVYSYTFFSFSDLYLPGTTTQTTIRNFIKNYITITWLKVINAFISYKGKSTPICEILGGIYFNKWIQIVLRVSLFILKGYSNFTRTLTSLDI